MSTTEHQCQEPYWEPETFGEIAARRAIDSANGRETPKWHVRRGNALAQQIEEMAGASLTEDGVSESQIRGIAGCGALVDRHDVVTKTFFEIEAAEGWI